MTVYVKRLCYGFPQESLEAFGNGTISYREGKMDWDDEFDDGYDEIGNSSQQHGIIQDQDNQGGDENLDPVNITNPSSAYFFLSDDAAG